MTYAEALSFICGKEGCDSSEVENIQISEHTETRGNQRVTVTTVTWTIRGKRKAAEYAEMMAALASLGDSGANSPDPDVWQNYHRNKFMANAKRVIAINPNHLLRFLIDPETGDWNKTQAGSRYGRFGGAEDAPVVQAGHQTSWKDQKYVNFVTSLMLEDADLNQRSGQMIESRGGSSSKTAILIGIPDDPNSKIIMPKNAGAVAVDKASAMQWERMGLLPEGTVANATTLEDYYTAPAKPHVPREIAPGIWN